MTDSPVRSLAGLRILDMTMAWAGPMAVRFLSDLGADVLKIEAAARMDRWRGGTTPQRGTARYPDHTPGERPWNRNSFFNTQNRNKRSFSVNLKTESGKRILLDIVKEVDVLVENFSAAVMDRLGLGFETLREVNPRLVMVSMPAMGKTGPDSGYIAHGPTIEELAGTTYLQGYEGGGPQASGSFAWGDPIAAMYGAAAALTALRQRDQTGEAVHVDLSQFEGGVTMNAFALTMQTFSGVELPRIGNRDRLCATQGVYACAGEERWISITITDPEMWQRLAAELGIDPEAVGRLRSEEARRAAAAEVDALVAERTRDRQVEELLPALQAAGVIAGAVRNAKDLAEDQDLHQRDFYVKVKHPEAGEHFYPAAPFRMRGVGAPRAGAAPLFAEHNVEVLRGLGYSSAEIEELEKYNVIAFDPVPQGD